MQNEAHIWTCRLCYCVSLNYTFKTIGSLALHHCGEQCPWAYGLIHASLNPSICLRFFFYKDIIYQSKPHLSAHWLSDLFTTELSHTFEPIDFLMHHWTLSKTTGSLIMQHYCSQQCIWAYTLQWHQNERDGASITGDSIAQPFVQAPDKKNTKVLCYWPLWGECTGDRWFPSQRASNTEMFNLMTS